MLEPETTVLSFSHLRPGLPTPRMLYLFRKPESNGSTCDQLVLCVARSDLCAVSNSMHHDLRWSPAGSCAWPVVSCVRTAICVLSYCRVLNYEYSYTSTRSVYSSTATAVRSKRISTVLYASPHPDPYLYYGRHCRARASPEWRMKCMPKCDDV